jgi:hypothetical protein
MIVTRIVNTMSFLIERSWCAEEPNWTYGALRKSAALRNSAFQKFEYQHINRNAGLLKKRHPKEKRKESSKGVTLLADRVQAQSQ